MTALGALLRGKVEQSKIKQFKAIVFVSTCDSVDFHHALFSRSFWPDDLPARGAGDTGGESDSDEDDDDDMAGASLKGRKTIKGHKAQKAAAALDPNAERAPLIDVPLYRLHGNLAQIERTETYFRFCKAEAGILFTTDVAARGLDLPALDCIVQYDPPEETTEYIHRVGRTARMGRKGEAVLFLRPEEMAYLDVLKTFQINLQKISLMTVMHYLKCKDVPRQSSAPLENVLQTQFQRIVASDEDVAGLARHAYHSFCRAYAAFPKAMKKIFHVRNLHLGHVARSFALISPPSQLVCFCPLLVCFVSFQRRNVTNYRFGFSCLVGFEWEMHRLHMKNKKKRARVPKISCTKSGRKRGQVVLSANSHGSQWERRQRASLVKAKRTRTIDPCPRSHGKSEHNSIILYTYCFMVLRFEQFIVWPLEVAFLLRPPESSRPCQLPAPQN